MSFERPIQAGAIIPVILMSSGGKVSVLDHVPAGAVTTLAADEHRVHIGVVFDVDHYISSLASSASLNILIQTGPHAVHIFWEATAGGNALNSLFEGAVVSNPGTPLPVQNLNRTSGAAPTVKAFHTPTITSNGMQLHAKLLAGGSGGAAAGGNTKPNIERVLKPNTNYIIRLTNTSTNAQPVSLDIEFYDEAG